MDGLTGHPFPVSELRLPLSMQGCGGPMPFCLDGVPEREREVVSREFFGRPVLRFEFEPFLKVLQDWPIALAHIVPPVAVALAKHPVVDNYKLSHLKWLLCF